MFKVNSFCKKETDMLSYVKNKEVIDIEKRLNAIESEIGSSTHDTINTRMEIRH